MILIGDGELMENRNKLIDCFRAMAVILVSFYHIYRHINPSYEFFGVNLYAPILNGWMGVGIFFVISGYCMGIATKSMARNNVTLRGYGEYLKKRIFRISGPYYIAIAVWFFILNVFGLALKPIRFNDFITHVLYVHNFDVATMYSISGVFWSLAVEMQFYIILPILMMLFTSNSLKIKLLIFLFFISLAIHVFASNNILLTWGIASYLFVFVFGWFLYLNNDSIGKFIGNKKLLLLLVGLYIAMMYIDPGYIKVNKFYELLVSVVFGLVMLSVINLRFNKTPRNNLLVNVLSWIGRMSFSIYLYNYAYVLIGFPTENSHGVIWVGFILFVGIVMFYMVEKPYEIYRKKGKGAAVSNIGSL
ncbi:acyltransferase family protein [Pantoea endophytica]